MAYSSILAGASLLTLWAVFARGTEILAAEELTCDKKYRYWPNHTTLRFADTTAPRTPKQTSFRHSKFFIPLASKHSSYWPERSLRGHLDLSFLWGYFLTKLFYLLLCVCPNFKGDWNVCTPPALCIYPPQSVSGNLSLKLIIFRAFNPHPFSMNEASSLSL